MPKTSLQRRVAIYGAICGGMLTLLVLAADAIGLLGPMESWLFDRRAKDCQFFTPPPSSQIVHLDIDDESLITIHRWPWPRSTMAALLDEVRLAGPKAVAIDVLFSEPLEDTIEKRPDGSMVTVPEDSALVEAIRKLDCVVLPESFSFGTAPNAAASLHASAVAELSHDLMMNPAELARRLARSGAGGRDLATRLELDMVDIQRDAVRDALRRRLSRQKLSLDAVRQELIASVSTPTTLPSGRILLPVGDVIAREYPHVLAELALRQRFSRTEPDGLMAAPPDALMNETPLPELCDVIRGSGFADYNIFAEPVVRAVPLLVRSDKRLYPQFAFAMACKMLDVDLSAVRVEDDAVVLPAPGGQVRIPVRSRYSPALKRRVGAIVDIPWFGSSEWATMYDWPEHRKITRHYSMNLPWAVVEVRRKIARNNQSIDTALKILMLDDAEAAKYAARHLDPEDIAARNQAAEQVLANLRADGWDEMFRTKRLDQLSADERLVYDQIAALKEALGQNAKLDDELHQKRKQLAELIGGKGVLIGSVATASGDVVTTPLHARCPGVVVHGAILNAILNRDFWRTAPQWMEVLIALACGSVATLITSRMAPVRAVPLLIFLAGAYFAINGLLLFDRYNLIVNAAAPLVAIGICWAGVMVVRLILEGLERIRLSKEAAIINHEISLARKVQEGLIPKQLKILTHIESHGWTLAATTTGGDCFDLWGLADGRMGILVADASGHGLGPSLIVLQVRALVRALCDLYSDPQKLLDRINGRLASDLDGSKFATAFLGFVTEDGCLHWGSAGHGPMLWCSKRDTEPAELEATGLPLGVSDEWYGEPDVPPLQLEPGGWLAVISDGIFEAPSPTGEQFDISRVKQVLKDSCDSTCEQIVTALRQAVRSWQGKDEPHDDQTIVIIRRSPAPVSAAADAAPAPPAALTVAESVTPAS